MFNFKRIGLLGIGGLCLGVFLDVIEGVLDTYPNLKNSLGKRMEKEIEG